MADCESLEHRDVDVSNTNTTAGTVVYFSCDEFGHRPSGGIDQSECLGSGNWSTSIPSCEWSWDFKTKDKIIFGTSVGAIFFLIVVSVVAIFAYFRCYKKRDELDERMFGSSQPSSSPATGYNGPYNEREFHIDPYVTYQDVYDKFDKFEGYQMNGMQEKPWLGFIPRPKLSHEPVYT